MKTVTLVILAICALASAARADSSVPNDLFSVEGHNFDSKAAAIRYVINSGKRLQILETRCLIMTNKLTFKACPKNKAGAWESEQFAGLKVTQ